MLVLALAGLVDAEALQTADSSVPGGKGVYNFIVVYRELNGPSFLVRLECAAGIRKACLGLSLVAFLRWGMLELWPLVIFRTWRGCLHHYLARY